MRPACICVTCMYVADLTCCISSLDCSRQCTIHHIHRHHDATELASCHQQPETRWAMGTWYEHTQSTHTCITHIECILCNEQWCFDVGIDGEHVMTVERFGGVHVFASLDGIYIYIYICVCVCVLCVCVCFVCDRHQNKAIGIT